ncbi:type II toxin-antitoxin system antitoxin DNA ADP-ribosyl glycohydrolase DarG [Sinomicrobium sp.]
MIKYTKGNLLDAKTEALVNTVNTVGVMGKGIALQFKNRFPNNYKVYRDACKTGSFKTGQVLVVQEGDLLNQKTIVNFPTKAHWKEKSKYDYIDTGLVALKEAITKYRINSIAIPPLGCGNGGLDWSVVKKMIEEHLNDLRIDIYIYEPNNHIKEILQKGKNANPDVKLTPAKAMLLYLLFAYESKGEQSSLFVANKLAYFLQRKGEKLRLNFEAHHYGPYTVQLNHLLLPLNGIFIKGMEQNVIKPFEPIYLNYNRYSDIKQYIGENLNISQKQRLEDVISFLDRFESTFALELLATVDYLMSKVNTTDPEIILNHISKWNNRKINLFKPSQVQIAVDHIKNYSRRSLEYSS